MNRKISFVDANKNKVNLELEINNGRFSISGDTGNGCGQIVDSIEPRTESQKKLLEIWRKWHLNDMHAGCEHQEELGWGHDFTVALTHSTINDVQKRVLEEKTLKENERILKEEFERTLNLLLDPKGHAFKMFLKKHLKKDTFTIDDVKGAQISIHNILNKKQPITSRVYSTSPKIIKEWIISDLKEKYPIEKFKAQIYEDSIGAPCPVCGYCYGTSWLKRDLPENFEVELNSLLDEIEKEEKQLKEEYKEKNITWEDVQEEHGNYGTALAIHLDLSPAEALDSIESRGDNDFSCQGIEYFVGTEEKAKEAVKEYFMDDDGYLWREAVAAKKTELGLEEWAEWAANQESPGIFLNSWDGNRENIDSELLMAYGVEFICRRG